MPIPLRLRHPITHDGAVISELTFRDHACAGDLRGIKLTDLGLPENVMRIASRMTGQPDPVLDKLSIPDFIRVAEVVGGFFESGPANGNAPSQ